MNIMPFYELRTRLYSCASAGCSAINEDFRLKRAVNDFAPLAEANKAFGKLYNMCGRLFSEDNTALLLADCIALADALAVAQGGYADNSETSESVFSADVPNKENAPYSAVNALADKIEKAGQTLEKLTADEKLLFGDQRILAAFIKKSDVNSYYFAEFAEMICSAYGKSIVIPLKNAVGMSSEKASGNQVRYVANIAGYDENDWYLTLAHNENAPQGVRLKAIEALGRDVRNGQELLDIYNTEKGKIKNAAMLEIAKLGIPEADEILAKMKAKFKQTYWQYFAVSPSAAAVGFAREMIGKAFGGTYEKDKPGIDDVISLMQNKSGADDCFISLAQNIRQAENSHYLETQINNVLIANLANKPNDEYKALISRLYRSDGKMFFTANFFLRLIDDPQNAFSEISPQTKEDKNSMMHILNKIEYSNAEKKYYISYVPSFEQGNVRIRLPLFSEMPQNIIDFVGDTSVIESSGLASKFVNAVKNAFSIREFSINEYSCMTFSHMLSDCSPEDYERIRASAVKLALMSLKVKPDKRNASCFRAIDLIRKYYRDGKPEDYLGITENFAMYEYRNGRVAHLDFLDDFPLSREQKLSELEHLRRSLAVASFLYNGSEGNRNILNARIDDMIAKIK